MCIRDRFWQTTPRLGLYGEYNRLWVDGGHGDEAELRATYRLTRKSTVGLNARFLFVPVNGVTDLRAWVSYALSQRCLLYTSDAADERSSVDLGGRRIIKKK